MRLLRLALLFAAAAWGISAFGIFASWSTAAQALQDLGAQPIQYNPMLEYWFRMTAGAFTFIGCCFLALAIWPTRFQQAIPWFGGFLVAEGIVLLVHGTKLSLPALPFYFDTIACLVSGTAIIVLSRKVPPASSDQQCLHVTSPDKNDNAGQARRYR